MPCIKTGRVLVSHIWMDEEPTLSVQNRVLFTHVILVTPGLIRGQPTQTSRPHLWWRFLMSALTDTESFHKF